MKTAISMVLDRSASMGSCRQSTIDAVNSYLAEARADTELKDADFDLTIFDSESIDSIRSGKPTDISDISREDFEPRASTPLYDAVGRGIDDLDRRATDGKAILVIVTDGQENMSRKHTHESIKALLDDRQAKGWLVVFLGAGLSAASQGLAMGIAGAKVANIGLDHASLHNTMAAVRGMNSAYAATLSLDEASAYTARAAFSAGERRAMGDASEGAGLIIGGKAVPGGIGGGKPQDAWPKARSGDAWGG